MKLFWNSHLYNNSFWGEYHYKNSKMWVNDILGSTKFEEINDINIAKSEDIVLIVDSDNFNIFKDIDKYQDIKKSILRKVPILC